MTEIYSWRNPFYLSSTSFASHFSFFCVYSHLPYYSFPLPLFVSASLSFSNSLTFIWLLTSTYFSLLIPLTQDLDFCIWKSMCVDSTPMISHSESVEVWMGSTTIGSSSIWSPAGGPVWDSYGAFLSQSLIGERTLLEEASAMFYIHSPFSSSPSLLSLYGCMWLAIFQITATCFLSLLLNLPYHNGLSLWNCKWK